ncbi:MAG: type I secretion system permease/ATPase, partial [Deltaproteobacteria bacterium]|nr:type I secretion system permease/ATPase [Deltaproteobacteria bacterium]
MSEENGNTSPGDWDPGRETDTHDDPLLDCLIQLSKLHGRSVSRTGLSAGLPLVHNRLTVELFTRAADRADLASRTLRKPLDDISALQLPMVLLLHERRACVLGAKEDGSKKYKLLLPETGMGEKVVSREELEKLYAGYGIFVRPKFRMER